ncbi:RluA family pseudouridine synthase [Acinetobacter sp. WCHAc060025]|uniref:RluA family pseudouridine synthase n=1 Tax=Acinetobacter sp. WCHAc060025 TaxID=2518625 RepID=UPI0010233177|nr:RluA family pseudouridine synthase [Acinetobacter sp. WCHAc060025]RZG73411.1 pseudouridylate synthase [Acinetobacter sp. WCHAc060025]
MKNTAPILDYVPPMRDGVTASKVFLQKTDQTFNTIFEYLKVQFAHISETEWRQRFDDHLIIDMTGQCLNINSPFQTNTHIYYYRFLAHETHVPFQEEILFENDDLLVVDKPHFLTISPTGQYVQETLLVRLKKTTGNPDLTPIHRLDRETAGIVLFSKRPETRGLYQQMFAGRKVDKTYHAIAPYRADLKFPYSLNLRMDKGEPFYTMQVIEGESNSHTDIEVLECNGQWAKYLLKPSTGKQHQLRVHLNWLNIPIKNDPFYPVVQHKNDADFTQPLQLLAKEIHFKDPIIGENLHFCSEFELTL